MSLTTDLLPQRLERVRATIAEAAARVGRRADEITLVGVTKTVAPEAIRQAALLGLRDFGENYVQEAAAKRPLLRGAPFDQVRWHLVGHLQTNKVKAALELFDIIQTVDSLRLAEAISRRAGARVVPVLLEVKFGEEPTRVGFRPDEIPAVAPRLLELPGLSLQGLMTVPPLGLGQPEVRAIFRALRELRDAVASKYPRAGLRHLSMGMTDDYQVAIEEGATIVRIGRAIFGERPT